MKDGWTVGEKFAVFSTQNYGDIVVSRSTYDEFSYGMKNINISDEDGYYHEYRNLTDTGIAVTDVSKDDIIESLDSNPTPGTAYWSGYANATPGPYVPLPMVVYKGDSPYGTVTNITAYGLHILNPGLVQRRVIEIDGRYFIETVGIGEGYLKSINSWQVVVNMIWSAADSNLMQDLYDRGLIDLQTRIGADWSDIECFPSYTPILTPSNTCVAISSLRAGDVVLSFASEAEDGRGGLVPRRIRRLFRNTTTEWIKLSWDEAGEARELTLTPGHHVLDQYGQFPTIEAMLRNGVATVVLASGELAQVTAERIVYSAATAHLYERAQCVGMMAGNAALQPVEMDAWQTYNFEVEDLHTYVAGGVRVHNDSWLPGKLGNFLNSTIDDELGVIDGSFADTLTNGLSNSLHFLGELSYAAVSLAVGVPVGVVIGAARFTIGIGSAFTNLLEGDLAGAGQSLLNGIGGAIEAVFSPIANAVGGLLESVFGPGGNSNDPSHTTRTSWTDTDGRPHWGSVREFDRAVGNGTVESGGPRNSDKDGSSADGKELGKGGDGRDGGLKKNKPILLDLDGDGIQITDASQSTQFVDAGGTGLLHRSAWAGAGNGVLFFDPDGSGAIAEQRQYVFTEWDPTAQDDLAALRSVFDSNGDGRLTAADAAFAQFKVLVTNADGSTTAQTLAQLGITEINLTADATRIVLPDGSVITGQTVFTRANGTTGTVANTTLMAEAQGHRVVQLTSTDGSGNRVVLSTAYDADGSVDYAIRSVTTPTGGSTTNTYDDNGDGVWDRIQTIARVTNGDGSRTETVVNNLGGLAATAVLVDRTVTVTSADNKVVTIHRDTQGGGWFDAREVRTTLADGSRTLVRSELAPDGTVLRGTSETMSANGLTRSEGVDADGNGASDLTTVHAITVAGDNSRIEVVSQLNGNGSVRSVMTEAISANGRSHTETYDLDGDGDTDRVDSTVIVVNADSSTVSTIIVKNGDGSVRTSSTETQEDDGLSGWLNYTSTDADGDGDIDQYTRDDTIISASNSRLTVKTIANADGSIRHWEMVNLAANKVATETWVDQNQNGVFEATDLVKTVEVDQATLARTTNVWDRNPDGSFKAKMTSVSTADGLNITTQRDIDGDGDIETTVSDVTVLNAANVATQTISTINQDATLRSRQVVTTSADGLSVTIQSDLDGYGGFDYQTVDGRVLAADQSVTQTVTNYAGNGTTVLSKSITYQSPDRRVMTVRTDLDGDGITDRYLDLNEEANGNATRVDHQYFANGRLSWLTSSTTGGNGLWSFHAADLDGDSAYETYTHTHTTLSTDGSKTTTVDIDNGDLSNRSLELTYVTDDGLLTRTYSDRNGDNSYERVQSRLIVLNSNGSVSVADETFTGELFLLSQTNKYVTDDGLITIVNSDADGDGDTDLISDTRTVLLNDGGSTTTAELRDGTNALRSRMTTTTSDDGRNVSVFSDLNGDGQNDATDVRQVLDNGTKITTTKNLTATGQLQSQTVHVIADDGLYQRTEFDHTGDGVADQVHVRAAELIADGSTFTVEARYTGAYVTGSYVLIGAEYAHISDDGWSVKTYSDLDGNNDYEFTGVRNYSISSAGVETTYQTRSNENGALVSRETVVSSADKRTVTTSLDLDGNGINDRLTTVSIANTGVTTSATDFYSQGGAIEATVRSTVSGNGLVKNRAVDYNGDNRADLIMSDVTVLAQDGTTDRDLSFRNERFVTLASLQSHVSDDGFVRSSRIDLNGDGVLEFRTEDTVVFETDGDVVRNQHTFDGAANELASIRTTTSGNGLSSVVTKDFTGDGTADYQRSMLRLADGTATETTRFYKDGLQLNYMKTDVLSADGRTRTTSIDLNGNGSLDQKIWTTTDLSRNVQTIAGEYGANGLSTAWFTTNVSANSLTSSRAMDIDGDGDSEVTVSNVTSFGTDSSRITVTTDTYGLSKVAYRQTTVDAANGLQSTTSFDVDGDGVIDGSSQRQTIINGDGSRRVVSTTQYADGTMRAKTDQFVSADGRLMQDRYDFDGNGIWDKTVETTIGADGSKLTVETGFNRGGLPGQIFETRVSMDGLETTIVRSGNQQTISRSALDNGSYTWNNGVVAAVDPSNTATTSTQTSTNVIVSHKVDDLGVESWTINKTWLYTSSWTSSGQPATNSLASSTSSVRLGQESKAKIIADAETIYDTVLDRDLDFTETEQLVSLIIDGQLDKIALVSSLVGSGEFGTRYGALSNGEFIHQIYLNALGRAPSLDELSQGLDAIVVSGKTRPAFALEMAERLEHSIVGNGHMSTNNFDVIINPAAFERSLDRAYVATIVKNLVDVVYDRDANAQEIDFLSDKLLRDVSNPDDIAGLLRAVAGQTQGVVSAGLFGLSGAALVAQAFKNALGRSATAEEQATWESHISTSRISADQFIASLAMSVEKLSVGNGHLSNPPAAVTTINGTGANETLTGGAGQDNLVGNAGNDSLVGGEGSDQLNGGLGADTLVGGNGNDYYIWSRLDGNDVIADLGSSQIESDIFILTDVASSEVVFSRVLGTDDLKVQIGSTGPMVTLSRMLESLVTGYGIEDIRFSDGAIWNRDDIIARTTTTVGATPTEGRQRYTENLIGSAANNTLTGSAGNDTLTGNAGADMLVGAAGEDTYRWSRGHGSDTINDAALSTTDVDHLILTDVDPSKVQLIRSQGNDDLTIRIFAATSASIEADILVSDRFKVATVAGWTSGQGGNSQALTGQGLERISFADGTSWNLRDILDRTELTGTSVANGLTGTDFDDRMVGLGGNDTLTAKNGNDTLLGGLNDDSLVGGAGSDTYIWRFGDGNDTISDGGATFAEQDVLFLADVTSSLVSLSRTNNTTTLQIGVSWTAGGPIASNLSALNQYSSNATPQYGLEVIRFADGVEWTLADIWSRTKVVGTAGVDTLNGTLYIDNLFGGAGNDAIFGGAGDDLIVGGAGVDNVDGAAGNDRFEWSLGDGNDNITDTSTSTTEVDSLIFTNVASTAATLGKIGTSLTITVAGTTTETVSIADRFNASGYGYGIEVISFADGVTVEVLASPVAEISVTGTDAAQTHNGWAFVDVIDGKGGADVIDSKNGNDWLIGGDGNDTLKGGNGSDTYVWSLGDDSDQIDDIGLSLVETDRLEMHGTTAANLAFRRLTGSTDLLVMVDGGANGTVTVKNRYAAPSGTTFYGYGIEEIIFDDGNVLTLDEIFDLTLTGGGNGNDNVVGTAHRDNLHGQAGADTLTGDRGNDTLIGGAGIDSLNGGEGDDVYVWTRGDGNDIINDTSTAFSVTDTLRLTNVMPGDLSIFRSIGSTSATFTVSGPLGIENNITAINQYNNPTSSYGIDAIEFADGTIWNRSTIFDKTIAVGSGSVTGTHLRDNLLGQNGADTLIGYSSDDTLTGGLGNDLLYGGTGQNATADGHDRYVWSRGHGNDTIDDHSTSLTELDTLVLTNVASTEVSLRRTNGTTHLNVDILPTGETILVLNRYHTLASSYGIETIEFSDGVIWDLDKILSQTSVVGSATADVLTGTTYADLMLGKAGVDTLNGGAGDDTLAGGDGADVIDGGVGVDTVSYRDAGGGVQMSLQFPTINQYAALGDQYISIEAVEGSAYADYLQGNAAANDLWGFDSGDALNGYDGHDRLYGGAGGDILIGGPGADLLDGGLGADWFYFTESAPGNDTVIGFEDEADLLLFTSNLADNVDDFVFVGNGTNVVNITLGSTLLTVSGPNPITLSASDFIFSQ